MNNAGRGITQLVSELTDEDLDEMMRVNVKSALYGMQAVLPHFQARGRGHLINVSSMLGRVPSVPDPLGLQRGQARAQRAHGQPAPWS